MYDDSGRIPIGSSKLLILLVIAVVVVMAGTVVLNGGFSAPPVEESNNSSDVVVEDSTLQYNMLGKNSYGAVTKVSGFGNPSSDIKVALILGVDSKQKSPNAIVPTLQNDDMLNYCYDVYIVNATSSSIEEGDENNSSNLTLNEKSESLASEFVVPEIINKKYNFTVDIHSTNDSNSYVFVPSEDTYTSKKVVDYISNNTDVGKYTPDSHPYTKSVSDKIISNDIPSIVYVSKEYYVDGVSNEINSILLSIDSFDFVNLFTSDDTSSNDSTSSNDTVTDAVSTNNEEYEKVVTVSNSSGNREVN